MIKGKNIILKKGNKTILSDVSFEIKKGRITSFIGKSGAGKTSLLKCVANLNSDYQGTILLSDKDIKEFSKKQKAKHIGFVAQKFNLFEHMTVLQNCIQPMMIVLGMSKEIATQKAIETLKSLDIEHLKNTYPKKISGGQQQRVAIARALCLEPEALLFDEPTSALDPQSTISLQKLVKQLCDKGITIAMSSHDMFFLKDILDCVYFLQDGKVVDFFDAKDGFWDKSGKIADFISHS